jgi:hypothetical protein
MIHCCVLTTEYIQGYDLEGCEFGSVNKGEISSFFRGTYFAHQYVLLGPMLALSKFESLHAVPHIRKFTFGEQT